MDNDTIKKVKYSQIKLAKNIFKTEYLPNEYGETVSFMDDSIISMTNPEIIFIYNEDNEIVSYKWQDLTLTLDDTLSSNRQCVMEMFRNYYINPGGPLSCIPGHGSKISFDMYYYTRDNDTESVSCIRVVDATPVRVKFGEVNKHDEKEGVIELTIRPKYCVLMY